MHIGIITFHRAFNCGAMLQAWALKTVIEKQGHDVKFPACNHVGQIRRWRFSGLDFSSLSNFFKSVARQILVCMTFPSEDLRRFKFKRFRSRFLVEEQTKPSAFDKCFDAIVLGSDQIWNLKRSHEEKWNETPMFLAENVAQDLPKIAYAASIGEEPVSDAERQAILSAAGRLDSLSMREAAACIGLRDKFGKSAIHVADPTLLLAKEDYESIASKNKQTIGQYILFYAMQPTPYVREIARKAQSALGIPCIILYAYQYGRTLLKRYERTVFGPSEFVAYIRDAQAVISLSFHGTAFALIYKKPFISLRDAVDTVESRQYSLLKRIGCPERLVNPSVKNSEWTVYLKEAPSAACYEALSQFSRSSWSWLMRELNKVKR